MRRILIINGPNLNLLGKRPKELYGKLTLSDINEKIRKFAELYNMEVDFSQSNSEGEIIDLIQKAEEKYSGIILNPGAYTHYSIAIRDCIESVDIDVVEVHLSNIFSREDYRQKSITGEVCKGIISGFGYRSYILALNYFKEEEV